MVELNSGVALRRTVDTADEADWINLLIASERVSEWLDVLRRGRLEQ